jgi:hypothetical protein
MKDLIKTNDIASMSTPQLKSELAKGLTLTAETLTRLGSIWLELERRGEDLSDLKVGIARTLPLIASGRLAAEAVVAFAGRPLILRSLEGVNLDIQRRLADGEPIPVYLSGQDNPESLPLSRIPSASITRVIADGVIRTPSEQRLAMKSRHKKTKEPRKYSVTVDRHNQTITIGKMTIPLATIISAMAESAGARTEIIDSPIAPAKTVAGKVTDEEKERLKAAAKAHGIEEWEMVRRAVVAMWLL